MGNAKGQTVFEFIMAAVLLFTIILYTLTYVNNEIAVFSGNFRTDEMNSKAVQISEMLINPYSKYSMAERWPVLSHDKMTDFNTECNNQANYEQMLNDFELYVKDPLGGRHNMNMKIIANNTNTGSNLIDCGIMPYDLSERPQVFEVKRLGIDSVSNDPIELKIWIW